MSPWYCQHNIIDLSFVNLSFMDISMVNEKVIIIVPHIVDIVDMSNIIINISIPLLSNSSNQIVKEMWIFLMSSLCVAPSKLMTALGLNRL